MAKMECAIDPELRRSLTNCATRNAEASSRGSQTKTGTFVPVSLLAIVCYETVLTGISFGACALYSVIFSTPSFTVAVALSVFTAMGRSTYRKIWL